jgi:hypothetical protein
LGEDAGTAIEHLLDQPPDRHGDHRQASAECGGDNARLAAFQM